MSVFSSLSKKHIPTLLGLLILGAALAGGVLFLNTSNTDSFLPRASPETTPKNLKITNVSDDTYSVSWVTDSRTPGFIRHGTVTSALTTTTADDRDQISGSVSLFRTHHVTIRSLSPKTKYFFKIGTGTKELYDDGGKAYTITTSQGGGGQSKMIYGDVATLTGSPSSGSIVYVTGDDMAPLSALTQSTGNFVVSLAKSRSKDLSTQAKIDDTTQLTLLVVDGTTAEMTTLSVPLSSAQPLSQIVVGKVSTETQTTSAPTPIPEAVTSKFSSALLGPATEVIDTNDLTMSYPARDGETITTLSPQFRGSGPTNTKVTLSVKQTATQIAVVTTKTDGTWVWTPPTRLKEGVSDLTASATIRGAKQTVRHSFTINTTLASSIPSFTASSSALTTPIVTAKPTATPTPEAAVTYPSTTSGEIVSGSTETTLFFFIIGFLFVGGGLLLFGL